MPTGDVLRNVAHTDSELAQLVAQARTPKAEHLAQEFAWEHEQVPDEPLDELIRRVVAETAAQWRSAAPSLGLHRAWVRARLAADASDAAVDALARRRDFTLRLNRAMRSRVRDCAAAPVDGPGLAFLAQPGRAVIVAYTHSGVANAMWYALPPKLGRTVYVPGEVPQDDVVAQDPSSRVFRSLLYHGMRAGWRTVGPRRLLEVYRELLRAGEACSLSADAPGRGQATVFDQPMWSTTAIAALARTADVPIVVVTGYLNATRFGVRVSAPLWPHEYGSIREGHCRVLEIVEKQLDHDPGHLLSGFPTTERREHERRRRRRDVTVQSVHGTTTALVAARQRHLDLAARRRAEQERLSDLRKAAAPAREVTEQEKRVDAAAALHAQARAEFHAARDRADAARAEHRRAAIAMATP